MLWAVPAPQQNQRQLPEAAVADRLPELQPIEAVFAFDQRVLADHLGKYDFLRLKPNVLPIQFFFENRIGFRH